MTNTTNTPASVDNVTPPVVAPVVVALDTTNTPAVPVIVDPATIVADQQGKVFTYDKTGDTGLDYALNFVGRLGFGPEHPAMVDATKGNFGVLKAELAALGDKAPGHAEVLALAEEAFSKSNAKKVEAAKAVSAYAVTAAESPERWAEIQKWASVAADPAEKAELNAAFAAGGLRARTAIDYLVKCFDKNSGTVKSPKAAVQANATTSAPTNAPLTAAEYSAEVQKLMRSRNGKDIGGTPAYVALQARRIQGQKLGK
jgi:hypothetical protein